MAEHNHGGRRRNSGRRPQLNHITRNCLVINVKYLSESQVKELMEQTRWAEETNRNIYRQVHPKIK